MDDGYSLLTIITAILSGGAGTLILGLLRHKHEARKLKTEAAVDVSNVTDTLIQRLQADGVGHRERVRELENKVAHLEDKYEREQRQFINQLRDAHTENTRLATRVAQLQTDLDIAQRQIEELRRRSLGGA